MRLFGLQVLPSILNQLSCLQGVLSDSLRFALQTAKLRFLNLNRGRAITSRSKTKDYERVLAALGSHLLGESGAYQIWLEGRILTGSQG